MLSLRGWANIKRIALLVVGLMAFVGVTPAVASEEVGLGPTGLLEAKKEGFDGAGFEFAVVSNGFMLTSTSVKRAVKSEACFSQDYEWAQKCANGKAEQFGSSASIEADKSYSDGDALIYALAGSSNMIAPKARAHAIRATSVEDSLPSIVDHAIANNISALFFLERWNAASRGMEVNCDAGYTQAAEAVKRATEVGIALFSQSGNGGDSYGLTFPSCLTGVHPVGNIDHGGELAESVNVGPGLIVAHSRFESIDSSLNDGKEQLFDYPTFWKALAVVGGIYAALLDAGFSPAVAAEAVGKSTSSKDDVIVKQIPIANYVDAKSWAQAKAGASIDLQIHGVTQVAARQVTAVLRGDPAAIATAQLTAYETFNSKTGKWVRTAVSANESKALRITVSDSSGFIRLVLSSPGGTQLTGPASFGLDPKYSPNYEIRTPEQTVGSVEQAALPEQAVVQPSVQNWPKITDPAMQLIELDYARQMQVTGKGVTVAIIDDGYQYDHSYLAGNRVLDALCLEMDESCPNGTNKQLGAGAAEPKVDDKRGRQDHGTMVAGTIGGKPTDRAAGGIAPDVTFVVARVDLNGRDDGGNYVVQALEWIYELSFKHNISSINMSFGYGRGQREQLLSGSACNNDPAFEQISRKLRDRGIAPLVASGNNGMVQGINGPACEHSAIAIGAADNDGSVIAYSNISSDVGIVAPARKITSLSNDGYREGGGTSNATPVVAGAFALARQLRPELSVDEILFAMRESADRVDDLYVKDLPRLNIRKFLEYLTPGSAFDKHRPTVNITTLGISCLVEFSSQDALRSDLRYRAKGSSTWSTVVEVASPFVLSGLLTNSSYEVEIGSVLEGAILWSSRTDCDTGPGSAPDAISGAKSEARGSDWAIVHIPLVSANGADLKSLQYQNATGRISKAISLGANRYYFSDLSRGVVLFAAFANEIGVASYAEISFPAFVGTAFKLTSSLSGFRTASLLVAHRTKLKSDLGALAGVNAITCTGYFATTASTSLKNTIRLRATNSCNEAKKLHPTAKIEVKTAVTRVRTMVGTVNVLVAGLK